MTKRTGECILKSISDRILWNIISSFSLPSSSLTLPIPLILLVNSTSSKAQEGDKFVFENNDFNISISIVDR